MQSRPILEPELDAFLDAFFALSPGRQSSASMAGMIYSGLALVEMEAYCRMFHVEHVALFVSFMRALDREFLEFMHSKAKSGA